MKRKSMILLITGLIISSLVMAYPLASFKWSQTTMQFGKIPRGKPVTAEFRYTNAGTAPLLIARATGSCGCTGVEYDKEPLLPGQSAVIKATFNAAAVGPFTKSITVESNGDSGLVVLRLEGEVTE
ncbi:DUF1573 domain-containing protein [Telluribacter sp.]|jgi:hypothetical protein|uniref:DUF1573 domain-containing protein n=1 Tax=Telluribacter sp. TaxID=1978767 RepID=UPI002E1167A8|nr:DUF1573 domain-containing protein [Telluribacter sp.]